MTLPVTGKGSAAEDGDGEGSSPDESLVGGALHHAAHGPPPHDAEDLADPERALAVAYAPAPLRAPLSALLALDERMGAIVASTTEPMIGLMRLAWWRESLEKLDHARPPAEPLLAALGSVLAHGATGAAMSAIEDGWAALLDGETDAEAIGRHGRERGGALFGAAAALLGADDALLDRAGAGWALVDLGHRHSSADVRSEARRQAGEMLAPLRGRRWSRAALPLAALAILAGRDVKSAGRRQGSPRRLLRLLALRLARR